MRCKGEEVGLVLSDPVLLAFFPFPPAEGASTPQFYPAGLRLGVNDPYLPFLRRPWGKGEMWRWPGHLICGLSAGLGSRLFQLAV